VFFGFVYDDRIADLTGDKARIALMRITVCEPLLQNLRLQGTTIARSSKAALAVLQEIRRSLSRAAKAAYED
jgi:hypothetical protein